MTNTLEMNFGIISINDAINKFFEHYPGDILTKIRLAHKGPFYKYSFVGNDGKNRHSLKLNAQTGDIIKNTVKALKPKDQKPVRRDAKKLNLEDMLSFSEINAIALKVAPVSTPIQWKLDRKKERTLWKVKISDEHGANMHEVKLDAQNGSLLQVKLKG
ncbi:MAG: PepSY domain-containing protein [Saccharofermentanales bacterium]